MPVNRTWAENLYYYVRNGSQFNCLHTFDLENWIEGIFSKKRSSNISLYFNNGFYSKPTDRNAVVIAKIQY